MPKHDAHAAVRAYLDEVQRNLKSGLAKKLTHRRAPQNLLEALDPSVTVIHEGQHIIDVGAPDFRVRRRGHADDFLIGCDRTFPVSAHLQVSTIHSS